MRGKSQLPGLLCLVFLLLSCGGPTTTETTFSPIDESMALFWDRQTSETADVLYAIVDDFNAQWDGIPLKAEYIGGYSDIFRKVTASIQAKTLPSMAVAYESMTVEYVPTGAVMALDEVVADPERGLSHSELDDYFPAAIDTNRYASFDGTMYSFPLYKSLLMLYFNKTVMAEAGINEPPRTWDEFLVQCRKVKAETGKYACALSIDCSTVDGIIFSMGGEMVSGTNTRYDESPSVKTFQLFEALTKENLAYQIPPGTFDDKVAFSQDKVAFIFSSSSGKTNVDLLMEGHRDRWGMSLIPQADPARPHTVLYGPNAVIFNTTPEQQEVAWAFVKYFTSPDVAVRWSLGTGYLPFRKSVTEDPRMQEFWGEWEYNRAAFDCLPFARSEPNLAGWQKVRDLVEHAQTAVLAGVKTGEEAARDLKKAADAVLLEYQI
jgi:ABC-type glycerol-3-phosphate transport system substrate-binding protein